MTSDFDQAMADADNLIMETFGTGCKLYAPGTFDKNASPPNPTETESDTRAILDTGVAVLDDYGAIASYRDEITLPHSDVTLVGNNGWVVQFINSGKAYRLTTLLTTDGLQDKFAAQEIALS